MKKKLPLLLIVVVAAPLAVASVLLASGIKGSAPRGQRVFGRALPAIPYSQTKT